MMFHPVVGLRDSVSKEILEVNRKFLVRIYKGFPHVLGLHKLE